MICDNCGISKIRRCGDNTGVICIARYKEKVECKMQELISICLCMCPEAQMGEHRKCNSKSCDTMKKTLDEIQSITEKFRESNYEYKESK